jgi:Spy/CpxP family protein refolding chaperone
MPFLLIFSLAFNAAFAGIWVYRNATRRRPPEAGPRRPAWAALGVTQEQEQKLVESWREVGPQIEALRAEAATHREALLKLMSAAQPDEQAILAEHRRVEAAEEQIRGLVIKQMILTRNLLTEQQRGKWLRQMKARGERFGWGRRRGGPPPGDAGGPDARPRPGPRDPWMQRGEP